MADLEQTCQRRGIADDDPHLLGEERAQRLHVLLEVVDAVIHDDAATAEFLHEGADVETRDVSGLDEGGFAAGVEADGEAKRARSAVRQFSKGAGRAISTGESLAG